MPFAFIMALEANENLKFDAVIVDEGQDFSAEMWLSLEMLLKDQTSKMFIFLMHIRDFTQKLITSLS